MKLLESVGWAEQIPDRPPVRLNYSDISIPDDIDFTFVAARHHTDGGEPDYFGDLLAETDVLMLEAAQWDKAFLRSIQGVANGSYVDFKAALAENEEFAQQMPGVAAWREQLYRQLYESESGVRVKMPDYPKGHRAIKTYHRTMMRGDQPFSPGLGRLYAARDMVNPGSPPEAFQPFADSLFMKLMMSIAADQ